MRNPITTPRHQFRRLAMWIGLCICTLLVTAWLATVPLVGNRMLVIQYDVRTGLLVLDEGFLGWLRYPARTPGGPLTWSVRWDRTLVPKQARVLGSLGLPTRISVSKGPFTRGGTGFLIPLWLPLALVAVPTSILWYRSRRARLLSGHCPNCHYNLTGNTSGICPECGTAISSLSGERDG